MAETSSNISPSIAQPEEQSLPPPSDSRLEAPNSNTQTHPGALSAGTQQHKSFTMQSNTPTDTTSVSHQSVDGSSSTQQQQQPRDLENATSTPTPQENRDAVMGGYETRGNLRTTGGAGNAGAAAITQAQVGGAPARAYMNEKIVPHLLEGMKSLAKEQPSNPLRLLGEYLIQRSNEIGESPREPSSG